MKQKQFVAFLSVAIISFVLILSAQQPKGAPPQEWTMHSLNLAGTRYVQQEQINASNIKSLTPRWLFQHGVIDGVSNQTTPLVVNGVMYVTDPRGSVHALDPADGHLLWSYDISKMIGGGEEAGYIFRQRGVAYADGVIYSTAGSFLFALEAETGKPVQGFGTGGQSSVILDVLRERYPDVKTAISMGYWFTAAPMVYKGVVYVCSTRSESHIPGGHVIAVDAKTGKVLWHFNTVPQDAKDDGWDIAGSTWVGGIREGGGIWETPTIDPELGMIYVGTGNPFGNSTKRLGMNLFSSSIVALDLNTGKLKWYFQQTHHDLWDYDDGGPTMLLDLRVRGQMVKVLAQASKNGFLYILNRENGAPINPIKEVAVPTDSPNSEERPWPTQPIPFTAAGKMMAPVSPVVPTDIPPERLEKNKIMPMFSPPGPGRIFAPGSGGGASYAPMSYSPKTGLVYVNAIDSPNNSGRGAKGYFSAFDPVTGELAWQQIFEGYGQAGSVVTSSNLVFTGTGSNIAGYFFAFDAKTGKLLWKFNTGGGVFGAPAIYTVNGEEFVTVASGGGERGRRGGDLILSFALPKS
jgi:alcohol dehydrogenase (cytochrome c)